MYFSSPPMATVVGGIATLLVGCLGGGIQAWNAAICELSFLGLAALPSCANRWRSDLASEQPWEIQTWAQGLPEFSVPWSPPGILAVIDTADGVLQKND